MAPHLLKAHRQVPPLLALGLAAGALLAASGPPAFAQVGQTLNDHTIPMRYTTKNQSIWVDNKTYAVDWSSGDSMVASWGGKNTSADSYSAGTGGGGSFSMDAGRIGLRVKAQATAGSVDIDCPLSVHLSYPQYVPPGSPFAVSYSYQLDPTANMQTSSPNAKAQFFLICDLPNMQGRVKVKVADQKLFDFGVGPFSVSAGADQPDGLMLFDTDLLLHAGIPVYQHQGPVATDFVARLKVPVIETSVTSGPGKLISSGQDYLVQLTGDLTALLSNKLAPEGVPPLVANLTYPGDKDKAPAGTSYDYSNKDKKPFSVTVGYQILDAYAVAELGFKQDFQFTPKPLLTLTAKDGAGNTLTAYSDPDCTRQLSFPVTPDVAQNIFYKMPPSGVVSVVPSIAYGQDFSNTSSVYLKGSLNFDPMGFLATGTIAYIPIPKFQWSVVGTLSKEFPLVIPVKTFTPTLAGFKSAPETSPGFTVIQRNLPLPTIGSIQPASCQPYNGQQTAEQDQSPNLWVTVTSGSVPYESTDLTSGDLKLYWDDPNDIGNLLDKQWVGADHTSIRVMVPSNKLTPGYHRIVEIKTKQLPNVVNAFRSVSTHDFLVNNSVPAANELHLFGGQNSSNQVDSIPADGQDHILFITGSGFGPNAKVMFNGHPLRRYAQGPNNLSQIYFTVPGSMTQTPGSYPLTVVNPKPGGGPSSPINLTVGSAIPAITSARPLQSLVMDPPETYLPVKDAKGHLATEPARAVPLVITGTNFMPGCSVMIDGRPYQPTMVNPTTVTVQVPPSLLTYSHFASSLGDPSAPARNANPLFNAEITRLLGKRVHAVSGVHLTVAVSNPVVTSKNGNKTGGGSNPVAVPVVVEAPYISDLTPGKLGTGAADAIIVAHGVGFLKGAQAVILSNDKEVARVPMTVNSPGTAQFTVPRQVLSQAGDYTVYVDEPLFHDRGQQVTAPLHIGT